MVIECCGRVCVCVRSFYYPVDISTTVFSYSRAVHEVVCAKKDLTYLVAIVLPFVLVKPP